MSTTRHWMYRRSCVEFISTHGKIFTIYLLHQSYCNIYWCALLEAGKKVKLSRRVGKTSAALKPYILLPSILARVGRSLWRVFLSLSVPRRTCLDKWEHQVYCYSVASEKGPEGGRSISQSYSRGSCLRNVSGQDHPAKIPNTLALARTGTAFGLNFSSKRIFPTRHTLLDLDGMVRSKKELSFGNTGVKAAPLSDRWTESVIHTHARTLSGGEVI